MTVELSINLGAVITGAVVVASYLRRINEQLTAIRKALEEYPPHRHINGRILYPKDFQPGETEQLAAAGGQ